MYVIPLVLILLIALAIFASPIFAVILFVVFLLGLAVFKFLGRGIDPEQAPPPSGAGPSASTSDGATAGERDEAETGLWGEKWPEQAGEGTSKPR
jgi:hypothetical protein